MHGILPIDKARGKTSFSIVSRLRRLFQEKKIGHTGTLDPFATGVMILLIGRDYTRQSDKLLAQEKEYTASLHLGISTDSYDCDGIQTASSTIIPTLAEIHAVLNQFQGEIQQIPPMFSAKKVGGQKLCDLARKGKTIERAPQTVSVQTNLISYSYPHLELSVKCSKGTYIRSIASDIGQILGCGAHLSQLRRTQNGQFTLRDCLKEEEIFDSSFLLESLHKDENGIIRLKLA